MPRMLNSLTLADAKVMLSAAEQKAEGMGIAYNIAVVDSGGHLVAFVRQDDALIGSIDLAIDKAATARLFDKATADLATLVRAIDQATSYIPEQSLTNDLITALKGVGLPFPVVPAGEPSTVIRPTFLPTANLDPSKQGPTAWLSAIQVRVIDDIATA